jgi:hypothetical protein
MYLPTEENAAARPKTMLEVINNDLSMDSWTIASYDQDLIKSGIFRRAPTLSLKVRFSLTQRS